MAMPLSIRPFTSSPLLTGLRTEAPGRGVGLDAATRRNLELSRSFGTGGSRGSLLGVLDLTRTAMGARALRRDVQTLQDDVPGLLWLVALVLSSLAIGCIVGGVCLVRTGWARAPGPR